MAKNLRQEAKKHVVPPKHGGASLVAGAGQHVRLWVENAHLGRAMCSLGRVDGVETKTMMRMAVMVGVQLRVAVGRQTWLTTPQDIEYRTTSGVHVNADVNQHGANRSHPSF